MKEARLRCCVAYAVALLLVSLRRRARRRLRYAISAQQWAFAYSPYRSDAKQSLSPEQRRALRLWSRLRLRLKASMYVH